MACLWLVLILSFAVALQDQIRKTSATLENIGVCYGMTGNNLPPATDVINLYKKYKIGNIRLFDPNPDALNALKGTQIQVTLGVRNEDVPNLAASLEAANSWVTVNVQPYLHDNPILLSYISVGNEIIPGPYSGNVLAAMKNLRTVLDQRKLAAIKVTTVLAADTLGVSYPPSAGVFSPESINVMGGILNFLSETRSQLLVNVYPYFAYAGDPSNVRLDYAQFTAPGPVVREGNLSYWNLFDATVDAFYSAMEKLGVHDVDLVVSESGWPSAGNENFTTPQLASTYNQNFVKHIVSGKGTPKRPRKYILGFIFAVFNENLKPAGVEQNFGLFFPNMQPVYPVFK